MKRAFIAGLAVLLVLGLLASCASSGRGTGEKAVSSTPVMSSPTPEASPSKLPCRPGGG